MTKRGFSYRPICDTATCVSKTTFPQVITLQRWDILYNEEVDDLFLRTSPSIGGVVTCTWDTETGNAFRLNVSKTTLNGCLENRLVQDNVRNMKYYTWI